MKKSPTSVLSHFGSVSFVESQYRKLAGSSNWSVQPILGFEPPVRLPLGQVRIVFASSLSGNYTVLVSAYRTPGAPLLMANYGRADEGGFTVHVFDPVNSRTLQNGGFSFVVIPDPQPL
jgi:hypothetical protein